MRGTAKGLWKEQDGSADFGQVLRDLKSRAQDRDEAKLINQKMERAAASEKMHRAEGNDAKADEFRDIQQKLQDNRAEVNQRGDCKKSPQAVMLDDRTKVLNRSVLAPTAGNVFAAKKTATFQAWHDGWEIMRHGMTEDQLAAVQIPHELNSKSEILNTMVITVFRVHSAAYRGFGIYAATRSLQDSATMIAMQEAKGNRSFDVKARAAAILKDPVAELGAQKAAEIQATAAYDALCATFSERNVVADGWNHAKNWANQQGVSGKALGFAMDQTVPFSHIPTNVVAKVLDYSVVGGLARSLAIPARRLSGMATGALTQAEQRTISMAIGRWAIGSGIIGLGAYLGSKGLMSGTYDAGKRELNEVAGRADGAVKFMGRWIPLNSLSPAGNLPVIGATIAAAKSTGFADALPTLASVGVNTVADMPFAQGLGSLTDLKGNSVKGLPKYAASQAGSFVPTAIGDVASAFDDKKRAIRQDWGAVPDTIQSKIPGLRNFLPAKVDGLGNEVPNERGGAQAFNPVAWTKSNESDPGIRAMIENGAHLPSPSKSVTIDGNTFPLSDARQRELHKASGDAIKKSLNDLVSRPKWDSDMAPDDRTDAVQQAIRDGHGDAHSDYVDANAAAITREAGTAPSAREARRERARGAVSNGIEDLLPGSDPRRPTIWPAALAPVGGGASIQQLLDRSRNQENAR